TIGQDRLPGWGQSTIIETRVHVIELNHMTLCGLNTQQLHNVRAFAHMVGGQSIFQFQHDVPLLFVKNGQSAIIHFCST
ncbi:TPA: hypothetical protein ACIVNQ_004427, partial [Salmonella enterica subsp. enterica serovar Mississippi]